MNSTQLLLRQALNADIRLSGTSVHNVAVSLSRAVGRSPTAAANRFTVGGAWGVDASPTQSPVPQLSSHRLSSPDSLSPLRSQRASLCGAAYDRNVRAIKPRRIDAELADAAPAVSAVVAEPSTAACAATASASSSRASERRLITQLLGHFKQTAEVRQYMRYYGSVDSDRFAIIKVSGDVLHNEAEARRVASSLAFLHRIGLVPIVVHGAGLFTGRRSADVAAASSTGNPLAAMAAGSRYMRDANAALIKALAAEGVEAESLLPVDGVFTAERAEASGEGSGDHSGVPVGRITRVCLDRITAAIDAGRIPVVAALAHTDAAAAAAATGTPAAPSELTFSTQDATIALARVVRPLKIIVLRPEGGLKRTDDGSPVRTVDVAPHVDPAPLRSALSAEDAQCLDHMAQLYREGLCAPAGTTGDASGDLGGASVSVTSPEHLASELFTNKGAGTQVLAGEKILALDGDVFAAAVHAFAAASSSATDAAPSTGSLSIDLERVSTLVAEAFGATLPSQYFASLLSAPLGETQPAGPAAPGGRRLRRVYLSEGYRGVAIVTEEAGLPGVPYLDKFAVSPSAQGDKLGEVLWRRMVAHEGQLYWRSRSSNRVNPWYYEQSSGCFKAPAGDWTVFWRGINDLPVISQAIATALSLPPTFPKRVYPPAVTTPSSKPPTEQPVLK